MLSTSHLSSRTYSFNTFGPIFQWELNKTHKIEYGKTRKVPGKQSYQYSYRPRFIPCAYVRVIDQLCAEVLHGEYNQGHEAQRRASYAQRVLNATGEELDYQTSLERDCYDAQAWRSIVLTPILQRHLHGVPDSYAPCVRQALLPEEEEDPSKEDTRKLTIYDATYFYFCKDPTHPSFASIYYRNLIYRPEARWHLAITFKFAKVEDTSFHGRVLHDQQLIMGFAQKLVAPEGEVPPITFGEYAVLLREGLERAFAKMRPNVSIACHVCHSWPLLQVSLSYRMRWLRQQSSG